MASVARINNPGRNVAGNIGRRINVAVTRRARLVVCLSAARPRIAILCRLIGVMSGSCAGVRGLVFVVGIVGVFVCHLGESFGPSVSGTDMGHEI